MVVPARLILCALHSLSPASLLRARARAPREAAKNRKALPHDCTRLFCAQKLSSGRRNFRFLVHTHWSRRMMSLCDTRATTLERKVSLPRAVFLCHCLAVRCVQGGARSRRPSDMCVTCVCLALVHLSIHAYIT
eukprot:1247982-Prymnesium_polylepis.2